MPEVRVASDRVHLGELAPLRRFEIEVSTAFLVCVGCAGAPVAVASEAAILPADDVVVPREDRVPVDGMAREIGVGEEGCLGVGG